MGSVLDNLGFTQKWAVVDLILKKNKNKLPDRTIQYSNSERPATYWKRWQEEDGNLLFGIMKMKKKYYLINIFGIFLSLG